jgi:serine/threonine protein kinase
VIETPEKHFLVLELLEGGELFDHIVSKSRLPESEAAGIIRQLLHALNHMHSRGFAHRDLKPENVLVASRPKSSTCCSCLVPVVKIIDFGLCADNKTASLSNGTPTAITALETCCGSPSYAAPELLSSNVATYSGPLIDVWSLGVVSFALMIGRLPFDHENLSVLYGMIKAGLKPNHLPIWLTADAKSFLKDCLTVDPRQRSNVETLLTHPFITKHPIVCKGSLCRFRELTSNGKELLVSNLDEEALAKVMSTFPGIDSKVIRSRIRTNGLDYISATYFLWKEELSRSVEKSETAKKSLFDEATNKGSPSGRPSVVGATTRRQSIAPQPYKQSPVVTANRPPRVPVRRLVTNTMESPLVSSTPTEARARVPRPRPSICPPSQAVTTVPSVSSPATRRPSMNQAARNPFSPVRTPLSPTSRQSVNVPPPALTNKKEGEYDALTPAKTYLREVVRTPASEITNKKAKSSLLRKLIDSVSSSAKKRSASESRGTPNSGLDSSLRWIKDTKDAKNIVCMPFFSDPTAAASSLESVLKSVGIEVAPSRKNHPFLLSCVKRSTRGEEVRFVLELCSLGTAKTLCIQRRRLRGSSWQYKEVCEQILILCNNSMASVRDQTSDSEFGFKSSQVSSAV